MLRIFCALAACAMAILLPAAHAQTAGDLEGLWKAERHYGPAARGTLVIRKFGDAYVADMMGLSTPVAVDGKTISFELLDHQGRFAGEFARSGAIEGHWYSAVRPGNFAFASPVRLERKEAGRWEGVVTPLDDNFTLYLKLEKRADGTLGAFLRNPERNMGVFVNVERLERKDDDITLVGKRFGRGDDMALLTGRYDPENDVITIDWQQRGGSYDFRREGDESLFYPRGKNPERYVYRPPLARDDGWPVATLEDVGIDRAGIEKFIQTVLDMPIASVETPEIHGILIARHGKLVLEEYFHGEHRDKMHDTRSAAKSLTATVVGAALNAGAPLSLSSPVYEVMYDGKFPEGLEEQKRAMTLEHLLTMSSGYFCDDTNPDAPGNEDAMLDQSEEGDYYAYTLRVPMAARPGEASVYCSINANLALGMVGKASGKSPMTVFDELIGKPMQIENYGWVLDPAGHPYGGGSVNMLPRDFMKLGQVMLDGGTWKGKRILSRDFVERASSRLYHLRNVYYGYLWWGLDWPYKDRTVKMYYAGGNGGQGVVVVPELDLVIATYGGNYASRQSIHITQELPARYILPAVREAGDDKKAPVVFNEWKTPYGRSDVNGRVTDAQQ